MVYACVYLHNFLNRSGDDLESEADQLGSTEASDAWVWETDSDSNRSKAK
jgi:hypothetical protein